MAHLTRRRGIYKADIVRNLLNADVSKMISNKNDILSHLKIN